MDRREIEEEVSDLASNGRGSFSDKLLSSGNLLTMVVSLLMVAFSWGIQTRTIDELQDEIHALKSRDMTPGAQAAIGEIRIFDRAIEQRILNIESEMRNQRLEILSALTRLDNKLDAHMDGQRRQPQ